MGFYSNSLMIASLLFLIICIFVRRYQKFKVFIAALLAVLIITVPLIYDRLIQSQVQSAKLQSQSSSETPKKNPSEYLESFYNAESQRLIMFHQPDTESTPFDIVILHISSLSWDDLKEIGITQEDPFFKQFDYLFTNFNSAVISDSGAVMRLMLSNCGQKSNKEINKDELPNNMCLLIERLTSVGYTPYVSMDSNDINGDYAKIFKKIGFNKAVTITKENLTANALYLDEKSPLYSNYAILKKWFDTRKSLRSERTFLYHNSILLKQGSHWIDDKQWTSRDNRDQYKDVYSSLLKDIQQFIDLLKSSKRNTLLIIIPEYGRYLSVNSKAEDMPLPKITKVPVGIKFIGPIFNDTIVQQHIISKPASYFAISWILSKFIENSPFGKTPMTSEDIVFKIPMTDFVSEQDGRVIMEMDGSYLFYGEDKKWTTLTPEQLK
jgi:cellulose synthase operon protein YhjU